MPTADRVCACMCVCACVHTRMHVMDAEMSLGSAASCSLGSGGQHRAARGIAVHCGDTCTTVEHACSWAWGHLPSIVRSREDTGAMKCLPAGPTTMWAGWQELADLGVFYGWYGGRQPHIRMAAGQVGILPVCRDGDHWKPGRVRIFLKVPRLTTRGLPQMPWCYILLGT